MSVNDDGFIGFAIILGAWIINWGLTNIARAIRGQDPYGK